MVVVVLFLIYCDLILLSQPRFLLHYADLNSSDRYRTLRLERLRLDIVYIS